MADWEEMFFGEEVFHLPFPKTPPKTNMSSWKIHHK